MKDNVTQWSEALARPVMPDRDHIRGSTAAPAVLVEYGDYQCPYCRAAHPIVGALLARLPGQVCYVYRHFPLTTIHPQALPAAEAAEAAGSQQRFWPMHDLLFTTQYPLTRPVFDALAGSLGLDLRAFDEELTRHTHLPRVREDFMSGVRSGVNGTPSFFINGVRHEGSWDFPTLYDAVRRAARPPLQIPVTRRGAAGHAPR